MQLRYQRVDPGSSGPGRTVRSCVRQRMVIVGGRISSGGTGEVWSLPFSTTRGPWIRRPDGRPRLPGRTLRRSERPHGRSRQQRRDVPDVGGLGIELRESVVVPAHSVRDPLQRAAQPAFLTTPPRGRALFYGGSSGYNDLWSLSLTSSPSWSLPSEVKPPPNGDVSMIYDTGHRRDRRVRGPEEP